MGIGMHYFRDSVILYKDGHLMTTKIVSKWNLMYHTPRISHRWGTQFYLENPITPIWKASRRAVGFAFDGDQYLPVEAAMA
jgi:hypothetical protein